MVVVPGSEGDFGVMEGHAPYMSTLRDGELAIYRAFPGEPERIAVTGGFAEVSEAGLTVAGGKRRGLSLKRGQSRDCPLF